MISGSKSVQFCLVAHSLRWPISAASKPCGRFKAITGSKDRDECYSQLAGFQKVDATVMQLCYLLLK